jgi:ATP-dependent DNA helicase RecG
MSSTSHATGRRALDPTVRLQYLPGVGPGRAGTLEKIGLVTIEDLIRHYPRQWLDARKFVPIAKLHPGELLTISGVISSAAAMRTRGGRTDFSISVQDGTGTVGCYFFGQSFLSKTLTKGMHVVVSGIVDGLERRMLNPHFDVLEGETAEALHAGRLIPVHALTRGMPARTMRKIVRLALDAAVARMVDPLPEPVREAEKLPPLAEALESIHFPADAGALSRARHRLVFEELYLLQSVLELRRRARAETGKGLVTAGHGDLAKIVRDALPFQLTEDQDRSLGEIVADMRLPRPMQRLLLGDVGSGKTVVAFLAAAHAIEARLSVAFMAPTEILARQHAATCARLAAPAGIAVSCLTSATPAAERRLVASRLAGGEPMLVLGTQALLDSAISMPALGLAIVDEQHRFGVAQRAALAKKGVLPDVLVLTATPIPRTLMLACYGDLDVSRIAARPEGRGRVVTRVAGEEKLPQVIGFLAKELAQGRQAFVVVPAIEEGGPRASRAVEAERDRLARQPELAAYRVGMLHGKMRNEDKRSTMAAFAAGELHVLVATTVVEVGVDIPNATMMVVFGADSFGLTQLHQLRGRIGRGRERSVCVLIPSPGAGEVAIERLNVLAGTEDGFAIAEADLKLRGPGELWGTRQSGLPRLRIADLALDLAVLEQAQKAARRTVESDPQLLDARNAPLRETLLTNYHEPLELALAG